VAIEFRSFSKSAGFTGMRCAYTMIPKTCVAYDSNGEAHPLGKLWMRRQTTKTNGISYPVQRAAEAAYSPEGQSQVRDLVDYYMVNADLIRREMEALGYHCAGGINSPYVWINTREDSWDFFDLLLEEAGVVCTPGSGFGRCGEGYIRVSSFNDHESVREAMDRIRGALGKRR
jgi:LL-diaminopimelate aminotransferase